MTRRRLLLVGDPLVAPVLRDYFHLSHGDDYEVETVEYCEDALASLRRRGFDVVLVLSLRAPWRTWPSLSLPARWVGSESAILFLKQLHALHRRVPVIIASARLDAEAEALRNGAFALVPKPILLEELDHVVATALSRQDPAVAESPERDRAES